MRYMAKRTGPGGAWLDRDLPLRDVERVRNLSGPGMITATIDADLRRTLAPDGRRLLQPWATLIVAVTDDGAQVRNVGIFTEPGYEDSGVKITCPGFATYPTGYIYDDARVWGPTSKGKTRKGQVILDKPRPDPLAIVVDHWNWIQRQPRSDLGVRVVGDTTSGAVIGNLAEPYRLRWWEVPDLGAEIDNLASDVPFDYAEETGWVDDATRQDLDLRVKLGWPRLGRARDDQRFVIGENVTSPLAAAAPSDGFANDFIGIGHGEGSRMVRARADYDDGGLRRTQVITDKTAPQRRMDKIVTTRAQQNRDTLTIDQIEVRDHPNARIADLRVGDDILVESQIHSYGPVEIWVRITSITEGEDETVATLSTTRSDAFVYSASTEVGQ